MRREDVAAACERAQAALRKIDRKPILVGVVHPKNEAELLALLADVRPLPEHEPGIDRLTKLEELNAAMVAFCDVRKARLRRCTAGRRDRRSDFAKAWMRVTAAMRALA